jgi:tryptophan halogenase
MIIDKINSVVIVGGGSSGWMSAATLIRFYPNLDITLIESENIPTIGVGESTQASITSWFNMLGIDHKDMMKNTDASYKLGIKFTDFYEKNDGGFFYPFGDGVFDNYHHEIDSSTIWNFKKLFYKNIKNSDYANCFYPQMSLINSNTILDTDEMDGFNIKHDVAFHFDALKMAEYLKNKFAKPRGVKHVLADVIDVSVGDAGIEKIKLSNGDEVSADLFVDCTGFKALLIGQHMGSEFIKFDDKLPVNRAWAIQLQYKDKDKEMLNYTDSTALSSGWVWAAPLWSRIGTGYVYSDKFISPEDALEEFKEHIRKTRGEGFISDDSIFRDIKFTSGMRKDSWVKNVVAIGLSAGFIEPLESNGLHTTYELLLKLVKSLNRGFVNQWDIDSYNYIAYSTINSFKEFVQSHYFLSKRNDSEFWKHMRSISPVDNFYDVSLEKTYLKNFAFDKMGPFGAFKNNTGTGWHCIAAGMGYSSTGLDSSALYSLKLGHSLEEIVKGFILQNSKDRSKWNSIAKESLSHEEYLKKFIYNV